MEALVEGLTPGQLRWRPTPEQWSIAHCLEHLIQVTEQYEDPVLAGVDGAGRRPAAAGGGGYSPGWFGRWFLRASGPEGQRKFRAPKPFAPPPEVPGRVRERFAHSQDTVGRWIAAAQGVDLDASRVKHPFLPLVSLSVGEALAVLVGHQSRHVAQAQRVRQDPAFPS